MVSHEDGASCVHHRERTESGGGPLKYAGDPFNDDINGHFTRTDLGGVQLGLFMRAGWTETTTQTGRGEYPCDPSTKTAQGTALDVSDIELREVAVTAQTVTYRVVGWVAEQNTTSDWDKVEGDLTLTLR